MTANEKNSVDSMKSPSRQYLEKLLNQNSKYIKGVVLNVGGGARPYRHLAEKMINMDIFTNNEVNIRASIIENFPIKKNSIDTVICTQVLEHIENPFKVIDEIHKCAKKGSTFILSVPFLERYHADPKDYWRFTEDSIRHLLKDKFEIIIIKPLGGRAILLSTFLYWHRIIPRLFIRITNRFLFFIDKYEKNKNTWSSGFFIYSKKI